MKYMFKLLIKLATTTAIFTFIFMFASGNKAQAFDCDAAPGGNWGVTTGVHSKAMAGMIVHSYDAKTGEELNVSYNLRSSLPGVTSDEVGDHDPNKQIFAYPIGGGRTSQKWFSTGQKDIYQYNNSNTGAIKCDGWGALGPGCYIDTAGGCGGDNLQRGNHYVLNCGLDKTTGDGIVSHPAYFWIDNITNPSGQDGHWSVRVNNAQVTPNLSTTPMTKFTVDNGFNTKVELIWHPKEQPPQEQGLCNFLDVYNEGTYTNAGGPHPTRAHVQVTGVTGISVNGSGRNWNQHGINGYAPDANGDFQYKNKVWRYVAEQPTITITVTKQSYFGQGANAGWHTIPGGWSASRNCISVKCEIVSVINNRRDRPGDIITTGDEVTIVGRITNTSPKDGPYLNWPYLTGTGGNSGGAGQLGPNGGAGFVSLSARAPNSPQNWTLSYSVVAGVPVTDSCSKTVPVYQHFTASVGPPLSELDPTQEDPQRVNYKTTVDVSPGDPSVFIPTTSKLYKLPASGGRNDLITQSGGIYPPPTAMSGNYNIPLGSFSAGDQYCTSITVGYTFGYRGPGGPHDVIHTGGGDSDNSCDTVHDRPYLSTYGADTIAGVGGFYDAQSGACDSEGSQGIRAYTNASGTKGGSGAQLAAIANGDITGFASASMTAAPLVLKLSFANTVNKTGGGDNQNNMGGRFNQSACITNFFGATQFEEGEKLRKRPTFNWGQALDKKQTLVETGTNVNLPPKPNYSSRHTLYVDGDVEISGNIAYANSASWNIGNIPNFTLVVKGNIHIKQNVTRLDGTYIAQPKSPGDANSGIIYTCSQGASNPVPNLASLDNTCFRQLTVYGSLIAEQIRFLRTYKTLRESDKGENYQDSQAAEKIIFSPEIYLSPPVFNTPGATSDSNISTGIYEYITTLPPIL
jgi:hypothetical protein